MKQSRLTLLRWIGGIAGLAAFLGSQVLPPAWRTPALQSAAWIALVVSLVVVAWPWLRTASWVVRRWLFRVLVSDLEPEIASVVSDLRAGVPLNYVLEGAALKKEGYRHVSARIETMQTIFGSVAEPERPSLRDIGRLVGGNFIQSTWAEMMDFVVKHDVDEGHGVELNPVARTPDDVVDKIRIWAAMERTAGWGVFEPEIHVVSNSLYGHIRVRECFLTVGRGRPLPSLCEFIEGYMEEILTGLSGWAVEVTEDACGVDSAVDKVCVFSVHRRPKSAVAHEES